MASVTTTKAINLGQLTDEVRTSTGINIPGLTATGGDLMTAGVSKTITEPNNLITQGQLNTAINNHVANPQYGWPQWDTFFADSTTLAKCNTVLGNPSNNSTNFSNAEIQKYLAMVAAKLCALQQGL